MLAIRATLRSAAALVLSAYFAMALLAAAPAEAQFVSEADEARIGAEEHPKMVRQFGGAYDDDKQTGFYVARLGARMVQNSELAGRSFTFTLLNSRDVNAFALPGGYVYITRGILALMNTEAELAGVLGHEVGHVVARHSAQRINRAVTTNLVTGVLGGLLGAALGVPEVAQLGQLVGAGLLAQYSQEQEFEADELGVRYMGKAGYNALAQADLLSSLSRESELAQGIAGATGRDPLEDFFASHPNTLERVQRAIAEAKMAGAAAGAEYGREDFLRQIDGMVYGDSPEQGFIRGRVFAHPQLRFGFTAPDGFRLLNRADAVLARGPNGAFVKFDHAVRPDTDDPMAYLTRQWAAQANLQSLRRFEANGLAGATGTARIQSQQGDTRDARLAVVRLASGQFYRFLCVTQAGQLQRFDREFEAMLLSFRALGATEAASLRPLRLRIVTVRPGDTIDSLGQRMAVDDYRVERFRVLNALDRDSALSPGDKVKLVTE